MDGWNYQVHTIHYTPCRTKSRSPLPKVRDETVLVPARYYPSKARGHYIGGRYNALCEFRQRE